MPQKHIIKWAGGKAVLLEDIFDIMKNVKFERFVDLFAGSGVVSFCLPVDCKILLNDINSVLINALAEIKNEPSNLIKALKELDTDEYNCREEYEKLRNKFNQVKNNAYSSELGALFIYLNRRCFNGLYRENQKGEFNVPYREYKSGILDEDSIRAQHLSLKNKNIQFCGVSYEKLLDSLNENDLVYLDPPYYPCNTNCFTQYHASGFGKQDHERLRNFCDELTKRGIKFVLSNAPCAEVKELYKKYNLREISIKRAMRSAKGVSEDKNEANECIITNF